MDSPQVGQKLQVSPVWHRPLRKVRQGHLLGPAWAQNAGTWLGLAVDASQGAENQPFKSL